VRAWLSLPESLQPVLRAGGAGGCLLAFWAVGQQYDGFRIPHGFGVQQIHPDELTFSFWYLGLGIPMLLLLAWALDATRIPGRALSALRRLADQPWIALSAALVAGLVALTVRALVLQFAPIADDESTYVFIARTLLAGGVVNPSPGDLEFFRNQFIILSDVGWYGKYPIGHALVLALGEVAGLRFLVTPALTAASLFVTIAVGRQLFPRSQALLAGLLLLLSPQFLLTGATELSQTSSTLCLVVSLWALTRLDHGGGAGVAVLAGAALGFGLLVRPLPGVLFVAVACGYVVVRFRGEAPGRQLRRIAAGAAPIVFFGGLLALTQVLQTHDLTQSSYGSYHGANHTKGIFHLDWVAASFWGALLRQNLWLFGWPLSFVFLPFACRSRNTGLLWSMIVAEYAYRILVPKTVVASTGPIYVAEIVPVLALLSAVGMSEAAHWLGRHAFTRGRERVAALALASVAVASAAFLPVHLRDLSRSADHRQTVHRLLDQAEAGESLIFANRAVDMHRARSWAYFPENPSPDLSDERIFVRLPNGDGAQDLAYEFWQRRFPDRQAWIFQWAGGQARLERFPEPSRHAGVAGALGEHPTPR
jgi:hypothetical protein